MTKRIDFVLYTIVLILLGYLIGEKQNCPESQYNYEYGCVNEKRTVN